MSTRPTISTIRIVVMLRFFNYKRFVILLLFILTSGVCSDVRTQSLDSESSLGRYESTFSPLPDANDPRWQVVPIEEWEKTFHFLADSANSNLERLETWSATYNTVTGVDLNYMSRSIPMSRASSSSLPSYVVDRQLYSFYRDNGINKTYISLARQGALAFYNKQYERMDSDRLRSEDPLATIAIKSNLKAIITPDQLLMYEYDRDARRSDALQQVGYDEFGKFCVVLPPNSDKISPIGTIFDPQFFYYQNVRNPYKHWSDLELGLLADLRAHKNQKDDTVTKRVKVQKATIDDVDWFRIERSMTPPGGERLTSVYYFNSASGYCLVMSIFMRNEIERTTTQFEFKNVDGVYIPQRYLHEYYNSVNPNDNERKSFRYFDLVKAEVNKPIPDEQFVMDALGMDDDAVVYNKSDNNYYSYEKGQDSPELIANAYDTPDSVTPRAPSSPIWRSPMRITALALGLGLLVLGVIFKVRKKMASS